MTETRYIVTDKAGPKVAGRRVERGATLVLTEPEARYELLSGAIRPEPAKTTEDAPEIVALEAAPETVALEAAPEAASPEAASPEAETAATEGASTTASSRRKGG